MKKQNEKAQKKLSLKKVKIINISTLNKIKGGDGGDNNTIFNQDTSVQGFNSTL
ncbi:hypothetical protein [Chryseobacterium sp.]|uniref:hypothetical protein n=1 Tax=Chryseobacterium sp. TaxID=1871047 RepID=UPI002897DFD2|nr:hypothetical protein [Chryseobacterium sp.]